MVEAGIARCVFVHVHENLGKGNRGLRPSPLHPFRVRASPRTQPYGGVPLARRAPRGDEPRTATLTVRMTVGERALVEQRAAAAGVTPSAYAATVLTGGSVTVEQRETMHPALFAELSRIGNNINQLAHASNAGMPPQHQEVMGAMKALFEHLMQDEITRRRVVAFERESGSRSAANGSEAPRTRDEFQGRVGVPVPR